MKTNKKPSQSGRTANPQEVIPAIPANAQTAVSAAMEELDGAIINLQYAVDNLLPRLAVVSRPNPPISDDGGTNQNLVSLVPMAADLTGRTNTIYRLMAQINTATCLLCPTQIQRNETYCSPCGQDVWATRGNAEHGGEWAKKWEQLWARIEKARDERERANTVVRDDAQRRSL